MKSILAVIVLYRMELAESPTYQALNRALCNDPSVRNSIDLRVADNSPESGPIPLDFPGRYVYDGHNLGLAARYNQALAEAVATGKEWLLLFDQDTSPTPEYFAELLVLATSLAAHTDIAVIVPKLIMDGRILSPHAPRYRHSMYHVDQASSGVMGDSLRAFNSGALVRVSALQAIGGFPQKYWLDYLDHATFQRIQQVGGQIYVMHTILEHELSDATPNRKVDPVRLMNRLAAEAHFHNEFGSWWERTRHRIDLLRQIVGKGRRGEMREALLRVRALLHRG